MASRLLKRKEIGVFLVLIAIVVLISVINPIFIRPDNIMDVLTSGIVLGIAALGMLPVMIAGGIDVSIGSVITAVTVLIGRLSLAVEDNLLLVVAAAIAGGAVLGALNGLLVAKLRLPAIVATLGTMSFLNGLVLLFTNGKWIRGLPEYISGLGRQYLFKVSMPEGGFWGFPVIWLFWIGAILLTAFILRYTIIGRGVYAVGGNIESAQRIGFKSSNVILLSFIYAGMMAGIAATVHTGIMRQVDPLAFRGFEMQVIAAVVVGGTSVLGGIGSVFGTTVGVLFMSVINNGMIILHIPTFYQKIAIGLVILLAVSLDIVQIKIKERNTIKVDIKE